MGETKNNSLIFSLLLITFFTLLAYTPLIPFIGFHGDDFFFEYVARFYGSEGIIKSLIIDRPSNGYLLVLTYVLLGLKDNVFLWHIYVFFIRLFGGYVLFFALNKLWPHKLSTITCITLLFLIYPGFLQQVGPIGYQNILISLLSWIFSLFLTIYALKSTSKTKIFFFILTSLIFQFISFFLVEYYIGLEVLRFLLIMYALEDNKYLFSVKSSLTIFSKKFTYWSPYILGLVLFIFWRIFLFKSTREVTDLGWVTKTYYSKPLWILKIPLEIAYSSFSALISAYFLPIIIRFIRIPIEQSIFSILVGTISSLIFYLSFRKYSTEISKKEFGKNLLLIGFISVIVSLLPIIFAGRNIRLAYNFDRYTIPSIFGVTFIIIGFLSLKTSFKIRRLIISLLVMLSITTHLMNGFLSLLSWDKQKDLWWQLYWRAPKIENNTMLILDFPKVTENIPFKNTINQVKWYRFYWVDYQIWAPGNLFFNYNNPPQNHFSGDFLEDNGVTNKIKNQVVESITDRNITYIKDFRNTVIISTPSDISCLWVLDRERDELPSHANELLKSNISYSDVNKLVKSELPNMPPREIFGSEPPHDWCYYFQKASLFRQLKDWGKLSQLKEEVNKKGLKPKDPNEWLPFMQDLR